MFRTLISIGYKDMNVQMHLKTLSLTFCKQKQIKYVPSPFKASLPSLPCLSLISPVYWVFICM